MKLTNEFFNLSDEDRKKKLTLEQKQLSLLRSEEDRVILEGIRIELANLMVALEDNVNIPDPEKIKVNNEKGRHFRSEFFGPHEITPELIREISDFYRYIFNNDFPDWAVCPPCEKTLNKEVRLSAPDAYKTNGQPVPSRMMDENPAIPDCPHCGNDMKIFYDAERTHDLISNRLSGDGYVALFRGRDSDNIEGMVCGYGSTLKEMFEREWGNKYHYMAERPEAHACSFDKLTQGLEHIFPGESFSPDHPVFCWNCVALSRNARGNLRELLAKFLHSLPPEKNDRLVIGECERRSRWQQMLTKSGLKEIPGFMEGDREMLGAAPHGQLARAFLLPPEEFRKL